MVAKVRYIRDDAEQQENLTGQPAAPIWATLHFNPLDISATWSIHLDPVLGEQVIVFFVKEIQYTAKYEKAFFDLLCILSP